MARRKLVSRVDRFAGLSDRAIPSHLSRIESPDLLNISFDSRGAGRRLGYERLNATPFFDSSLRFNGYDAFARIPYASVFNPNPRLGLSIHVKLSAFPSSSTTVISRGFGTGSSRFFHLSYDPTVNSNNGGWKLEIYDTTAAALQTATINDGDAGQTGVGDTRHILLNYSGTGDDYDFAVYEADGTSVGSTTITVQSWVSNTQDWIIGVNSTDGTTIPAEGDSSYYNGAMAELRLFAGSASGSPGAVHGRELVNDPSLDEADFYSLAGYWKFNDGTGSTLVDLVGGRNGIIGAIGAEWVTDQTKIIGAAGLQFNGARGHIQVDASNVKDAAFTDAGSLSRNWKLYFLFTPRLGTGETTVRDQTLFWAGSDSTGSSNPEPLGIRVVSNQLRVDYVDGSGLNTVTLTQSLAALDGVRCRVVVGVTTTSGAEVLQVGLIGEDGTTDSNGPGVAVSGNPGGTVSSNWSIARKVNSYANPVSHPAGVNSGYCYLDDFALFKNYLTATTTGLSFSFSALFSNQLSKVTLIPAIPTYALIWGLPLNDGSGHQLTTTGTLSSTATLLPEDGALFNWDAGLVEPHISPPITLLRDFRRFQANGGFKRSILAICGTTLHEVDPSDGSVTVVSGSLPKGGKWSHSQYSDQVFLACNNGQRPIVYDGNDIHAVGIAPPGLAPVMAESNTASGSLVAGTYHAYVTYRNSQTGAESNPGPVGSITITGSNDTIDSVQVTVSPDPQVNQRRIWITAVGGGAGSTAFLAATIDDNTTTNYTDDILSLPSTPTMSYTGNEQAPQGAVVEVWKDRLFVGGNSDFPTRVYYSSTPGQLTGFNTTTNFEDADLDAGDPVIGLKVLRDNLIAYLRDGRIAFTSTGDVATPFFINRLNQDVGAVSEHSILSYENRHIFMGERDVWIWAGDDATNLSSPTQPDRPSVKRFIRETVNDTQKTEISVAIDRSRDTVWFALATGSSTRNNAVLTLDISQGVWSRYDLPLDIVAEIEDDNDEPILYGGSNGHIVKLNSTFGDGVVEISDSVTSGTSSSLTRTGSSWTENEYKGLRVFISRDADMTVMEATVSRNSSDTLYFREALANAVAAGDDYVIGGIDWYIDFEADFGSTMTLKIIRWLKMAGFYDGTLSMNYNISVLTEANVLSRDWALSSPTAYNHSWAQGDTLKDFWFGGEGRTFRIRICGTQGANTAIGSRFPASEPPFIIAEFQVESDLLSAR